MTTIRLLLVGLFFCACSSGSTSSGTAKDAGSDHGSGGDDAAQDTAIAPDTGVDAGAEDLPAPPDVPVPGEVAPPLDEGPPDAGPPDACAGQADGAPCDLDADPCTVERCKAAVCTDVGETESCESQTAQQPCWTFTCSKKVGCVPTIFIEGASCDDGNPCTVNDACHELDIKACVGTPVPTDDANPCTDDACKGGTVTHDPIDGAPCAIGNTAGLCVLGKCVTESCTPIDGGWSEWSWGPCSAPCDGGTRSGTRTCTAPKPSCGGKDCVGAAATTEPCNLKPCQAGGSVSACPTGLPYAPNASCLVPQEVTGFAKTLDTGVYADSYGVKLVRGPGHSVAALYKQQEWFERIDDDGKVLLPAVSLPDKNPSVAPAALGDQGFPAFYGPALGYDGANFGVGRTSGTYNGHAYFYTVDSLGGLVAGPLTLAPPGVTAGYDHGPGLEWTGTHWLLAWRADNGGDVLVVARINADATLDTAWADGGFLLIEDKN